MFTIETSIIQNEKQYTKSDRASNFCKYIRSACVYICHLQKLFFSKSWLVQYSKSDHKSQISARTSSNFFGHIWVEKLGLPRSGELQHETNPRERPFDPWADFLMLCNRSFGDVLFGCFLCCHVAFFKFFCGCRGFCHRTESDLFLILLVSQTRFCIKLLVNVPVLNITLLYC